jgi:UDP-glucuronate 4-epimerase
MRVLVTGSAGFIGFHLARRLLSRGDEVTGLDNMNAYYDVALKQARHGLLAATGGFRPVVMDLADRAGLAALVAEVRPDLVFHLAAQAGVRHAMKAPEDYVASNIVGSFHLLEACRAHPPRHLLMASTSSVYGASLALPFKETEPADTALNIYAASKRSMEVMAHGHAHLTGLPVTAFRFFTVYGPWGRPDMALFSFTESILAGRPIRLHNHGDMERDFTFVDDLVEAILLLAERPPEAGKPAAFQDTVTAVAPYRVVNIGAGSPVPLPDFVSAIERATGRRAIRELVPMQPGELHRTWADTTLLEALTGFRPRTAVPDGVARFVEWYLEWRRAAA